MDERIEIRKTPKFGSMKETLSFVKDITKESLGYKIRLTGGSFRFLLNTAKRRKGVDLVKHLKKESEGLLVSPDITIGGQKYWVLRYGPPMITTPPPRNFPTGYTVFTAESDVLHDLNESKKVCKIYRVWEKFYVDPPIIPRSKTIVNWIADLKMMIFNQVSARRQKGYLGMEGTAEERHVLQELDEQVYSFHKADMELLELEKRLSDLQFDLFDHPSETNISNYIQLVHRFKELMPLEEQYLNRRLNVWRQYKQLLEREYKVVVNLDFSMADLGIAAFIDLMKYVIYQHIIPEAVLTDVTLEILKSIGKSKVTEFLLNLLVHYGGLVSLEAQARKHVTLQKAFDAYIEIWEAEIPTEMIRFPKGNMFF